MTKFYYFIFWILLCASCKVQHSHSHTASVQMVPDTGMIHNVYFWLPEDISKERKLEFEQALRDLAKVPSIARYYWGPPAATEDRAVIDNSYDYAINVFFVDIAAQDAYQIDPLHLKFVEEQKEIFEKVIVYDNMY